MSVQYTQYNVGNEMPAIRATQKLMENLFELGFSTIDTVVSLNYNQEDNCFYDDIDLGLAPIELMTGTAQFEGFNGFTISFKKPAIDITLTARLITHDTLSFCLIDMKATDFYKFFKTGNKKLLIALLAASGGCIGASAGFGAFESEWEPYSKTQVSNFLLNGPPGYDGKQPPIGLLKTSEFSTQPDYLKKINTSYETIEKGSHTILLRNGAETLFASI